MSSLNPEELLSHADFVRLLARSLVTDEHRAADVTQETWMAALVHPPAAEKPLRAWLAKVATNISYKHYRGDRRRLAREQRVASSSPKTAPSAAEIAAREELRSRVVEAVQSLDEPWRSTILLRYYENLSHQQVADRLQVPLETMRTRLKKGLALLRGRLDALHGGDRNEWQLALAPLAGIDLAGEAAGAGSASGAGLLKGLYMGGILKVVASIVLLFGTSVAVWKLLPSDRPEELSPATVASIPFENGIGEKALFMEPAEEIVSPEKESIAPTSKEVLWRGSLIDYNGRPTAGVAIDLKLLKAYTPIEKSAATTRVESGLGGFFEIAGLLPGEYQLWLNFTPHRPYQYKWGKVSFDTPGAVEKDILVAEGEGAIVAGVVVDEESGQPLFRPVKQHPRYIDFYVALHNPEINHKNLQVEVDPVTGTFCMRDVPAATFDLFLAGPDFFMKALPAFVNTTEQKVTADIKLTVPPLGDLRIRFLDLSLKEIREIKVEINLAKGRQNSDIELYEQDQSWAMPEGKGFIAFVHESLGFAIRSFEIKNKEVFEIALSRNHFSFKKLDSDEVKLRIVKTDGSPLIGATLGLEKRLPDRLALASRGPRGTTDSAGCVTFEEIKPGLWSAWCTLLEPEKVTQLQHLKEMLSLPESLSVSTFHGIEIPPSRGQDFTVELVYPDSTVCGILCDQTTGLPIEDSNLPFRWAILNAPDQGFKIIGSSLERSGHRFELTGIQAGKYQLGVAAFGYAQYWSDVFDLREGQQLDMGSIQLEPVGTMEIEVFDVNGNPVRFWAGWEGKSGVISKFGLNGYKISTGKEVFGNLPFGPLVVEISTREFPMQQVTLDLEPYKRAKARVTLDPPE